MLHLKNKSKGQSISDFALARRFLYHICEADPKDRLTVVMDILEENEVEFEDQEYGCGTNIVINPSGNNKIVGAHFDCIRPPAANDNAASVVSILLHAVKAKKNKTPLGGSLILFDHEEKLCFGESESMGSYNYAKQLYDNDELPEIIVVLDVCGIGDTLIISKSDDPERNPNDEITKEILEESGFYVEEIYTPPSDNHGFSCFGYDSSLICVLPYELIDDPYEVWDLIHSEDDTPGTIDINSILLVERSISALLT